MAVRKTVKRTVTTKPAKKAAEKKAAPKKTKDKKKAAPSPPGPAGELTALLEELGDEEINWLITQARTMIYNHKVEEVNQAAVELAETRKKGKSGSAAGKKKKEKAPDTIAIEQTGNGRSFVMILGPKRLFLSLNELKELVKLTQVTDDPANASRRLFAWMDRERRDMVIDAGIIGPGDPRLPVVFGILREKFTVG